MDGFFLQQNVNVVGSRESVAFQCGPTSSLRAEPSPSSAAVVVDKAENDTGLPNHVGPGGDTAYLTADGNGEVHLDYLEGTSEEPEETGDCRPRRKTFTMRDPREESHHRLPPLGEVESGDDSDCVVVASSERKVEPLKINLARDREPIRTIIKLTPGAGSVVDHHSSCSQPLSPTIREVPGSPKITIKPPKPPPSLVEAGGSSSSTASVGGGVGPHQNSNSDVSQLATATTVMSSSNSSSSSSSSSIPKLTIKPVINPTEELLTVEGPAEQMQIIPKLLIKGSSLDATAHGPTEPHIVPKLTIRGVNNHNHHLHHHHHLHQQQQQQQSHYQHHPFAQVSEESSQHYSTTGSVLVATSSPNDETGLLVAGGGSSAAGSPTTPSTPLVPKLTIKMDNHHPHHHHHVQQTTQQQTSLRVTVESGGLESPIPKLHIKAILPEAGGGSSSTQSPPSSSLGMATAGTSGSNSLTSSEGVKLTIKPLPEPPKLPKLTIKTTGLGTIAETSDASLVSSTSCSFSPKQLPAGGAAVSGGANSHELQQHHHHHPLHLLTVAQQQPASPSDQHSNISSSSIPKLTIKPFSPKIAGVGQQQQSPTGSAQTSMAMGSPFLGGGDQPQVVPKLTIKPIPAPPKAMKQSTGEDSNSSSETSINSLESSPVSSSSASSPQAPSAVMTTSPSALRMTIKVPPAQDAHSIGGSSVTNSGVQTSSSSAGTVVTKLNIKPIIPPPSPLTRDGGVEGVENREAIVSGDGGDSSSPSEAEMDPSAAPIVIPKVTIKTLAHPRSQETEILSTPKVTLRPIPKPTVHDIGLPPESPGVGQPLTDWHSHQSASGTLNSNNSPTAGMTASDGGGSMDSPRIILKINKGSSSTTTSMEQQQQQQHSSSSSSLSEGRDMTEGNPTSQSAGSSILANELKRPATTTAAPPGVSNTTFSSASSSSLSSASSTTVSVSTTSSSAGSDPASPSSSAGGGDQGDPGSPEAKKSKLDPGGALSRVVTPQQPFINSDHNAALRQSLLLNHQQQQQQLQQLQKAQQQQKALLTSGMMVGQSATVSDVIVIDDDSKSENESMRGEGDQVMMPMVPAQIVVGQQFQQEPGNFLQQPFFPLMNNNEATVTTAAGRTIKPRRTRGTPRGTAARGGGGRQSRRGATGGGRGAVLLQENSAVSEAPRLIPGMLNHDDHEEGSSSDCMIVDDPATTIRPASSATLVVTPTVRSGGLSLESLLLGSGSKQPPSFYNTTSTIAGGSGAGSGEVEKNGTASNSSIGSVSSAIGGGIVPTPAPPATTTPGPAVRMSTRRGAGQLLKEVLANKHHDRDSGVDDEAKTDGEGGLQGGPTPSKRPRGRPKKQSVDLTMETTNGGGSSSSMDGNGAPDSNMMMALAMMSGGGGEGGTSFLRPDGQGMLGSHSLMEGIMPLPITPVRTPRTRGRGRGRGRGKLSLMDSTIVAQSPTLDAYDSARRNFALPPGIAASEGNGDPLFIDASTDATNFNLLFNHVQTPRGGVRTRGGRRGTGARGSRTPRGGGRGATKAARAAAVALLESTPGPGEHMSFPSAAGVVSPEVAMGDPLQLPSPGSLPSGVSLPTAETPAGPKGRARAARGAGAASKRKEPPSGKKAPRGKKAQEAAALLAAASSAAAGPSPITNATDSRGVTDTIFMTPMAGGLDFNRPKLHVRELKTPKNAVKSNTPPSSAQTTPLAAATTPTGTPGETTPGGGLQVFEEDTRMSGDFNFTTPGRLMMGSGDGCLQSNEESQSSYLSSTSITQDATTVTISSAAACAIVAQSQLGGGTDGGAPGSVSTDAQKEAALAGAISSTSNSSSSTRRPTKGKMEVLDAHRAAFTVDLLAEYEWPPPSPGTRGTDTFMLQEQIAEYLGVKSFKRKYPDLMRRTVDMEERNFLLEQGLASEKMCDLGLTAVYASEILDIMCTDYPEKYEEYTRYTREKHFRELSNRQQRQQQEAASAVAAVAAAPVDRVQLQKEKAIESASSWNCSFNRERRDTRRACMDLQTYVVHVPKRFQPSINQSQAAKISQETSNYPVALVPGQFSEYYTTFTPEELACYPINTILLDPVQMREIVSSERYRKLAAEEEARLRASDDDDGSSSSDDDSDTDTGSSSSSGEDEDGSSSDSSSNNSSSSSSSTTSSVRSASADSDGTGPRNIKKELDRRKRTDDLAEGEKNDESEGKASNSVSSVGDSVRRSSRALSSGTVAPPAVVEIKDPTDSDDSDVPLIAHAVRKKNLLSAGGTIANTSTHPSAGGGKRMQETVTPVKRPPVNPFMCAVCLGPENKNKYCKPERFVRCNRCRRKAHPSCIGMSSVMYRRVQQYKWQCSECKLCMKCNRSPAAIDSKMVYCDQCDRGYHLACKGLRNLPEGRWHCSLCTICGQCGARTPEGHPNPHLNAQQRQHLAMVAEWTHEYGQNELTKIREHLRTLCVPCVRIRRQRLQHPDQTSPNTTGTAGSGETKQMLNNNNINNNSSDHLNQQQGGGVTGAAVIAANKSQSQLMMQTSNIKQQPHTTVMVQTGSDLPNSHLPGGTKGTITG